MARASIDQIVGGIYRISVWSPPTGITFNQFLIDDEAPTLVHTGRYDDHVAVNAAIGEGRIDLVWGLADEYLDQALGLITGGEQTGCDVEDCAVCHRSRRTPP